MSHDVREIADAVLHEGYLLYPYQASSLKNLHRYPFGTLYPESFCRAHEAGDAPAAGLECLVIGPPDAQVSVQARFLQLLAAGAAVRDVLVPRVPLARLAEGGASVSFDLHPLTGELSIRATDLGGRRWKLAAELRNSTALESPETRSRDEALLHALCSAHLVLGSEGAEFVSSIDPPDDLREVVETCRSRGLWPVLVGEPGTRGMLLAAPIILYDYPELAPESPGDFFDGTEIDELLTLRVLTLTDEEKRAMGEGDPRARDLLERTEALGLARLGQLHGRLRARPRVEPGARVRLRPSGRADIFDLALDGKPATVQAVERDLEGRTYVAVTVDEDPGKDLGAYGHRFFFRADELEPL
jgi:hypothetical protein